MFNKIVVRGLLVAALATSAVAAQADTTSVFNMPSGETGLDFVTVGNPGNAPDTQVMDDGTTGYGSVGYTYRMGTYDVTSAQYCQFLNAVAQTDPYGLYLLAMSCTGTSPYVNYGCGIARGGSPGSYTYSVLPGWANIPANYITWADAARFCNWLQNGQPVGPEGNGTTETGAYTLNGGVSNATMMAVTRNTGATYFIPTENEWYKAAYYDPSTGTYWSYSTQSNTAPSNALSATGTNNANFFDFYASPRYTDPTNYLTPVGYFAGSLGPYGTYDMGGDVFQWNETAVLTGGYAYRGLRGGSFNFGSDLVAASSRDEDVPMDQYYAFGFRVAASVPEPGSITLFVAGAMAAWICWRRR